jgi:hypothetical protein
MAATAITGTVANITNDRNSFTISGTIAFSAGDYAAASRPVLNFLTLTYPVGQGPLPVSSAPYDVVLHSQPVVASGTTAMFEYEFLKGSSQANGAVQIFTGAAAQSGLAELSDGAVPAAVVADTIRFEAKFLKL